MDKRVFTVIAFEFNNLAKKRVYIILTLLLSLIVFGIFFIPGLITGKDDTPPEPVDGQKTIYVTGEIKDEALLVETLDSFFPEYTFSAATGQSKASLIKEVTEQGQTYGVLTLSENNQAELSVYQSDMFGTVTPRLQDALNRYQALAALTAAGIPANEANEALVPANVSLHEIVQGLGKSQAQNYAFTYAVLMLLYMAVMIYGQIVAGSVAAEKGNRTMELLITSTKPLNLLVGKVLGNGLAGLLQLFLILGSALAGYLLNQGNMSALGMGAITAPMVLRSLLFFVLAYFTFAFLFSALGSLVSRTEEVNQAVTTVTLPFVAVFLVAMSALFTPMSSFVKTMSFVPLFSPFVMFVRTQMTVVPTVQVLIAVVISLLTLVASAMISAKIYRLGTLLYGNPVKLTDLPKLLRR